MQGPISPSFGYILKNERDCIKSEQTVFYLKVLTASDSASSLRAYSRAFTNIGSRTEVNESSYVKAYRNEFINCVIKVENYKFGYKFPDLQEKGYHDFDDPDLIGKMFEELPEGVVKEIVDAAKSEVTAEELDRKK